MTEKCWLRGCHASFPHSGFYLSASECTVQARKRTEAQGLGLTRSTELAEGGRPGSRPGVTFNLDLVSIGVSSPASTAERRGSAGTPLHIKPNASGRHDQSLANRLKRPCTQSKYSRLRHTYSTYIRNSGVNNRIIIILLLLSDTWTTRI